MWHGIVRPLLRALVALISILIVYAVLAPLLWHARPFSGPNRMTDVKQLGYNLHAYVADNHDTHPPCDTWADATVRYSHRSIYFLRRPTEQPKVPLSAAFNGTLDKVKNSQVTADPKNLVTLFVMKGEEWNAWSGPTGALLLPTSGSPHLDRLC